MSFALEPGEPFGPGLRRVLMEQTNTAAQMLEDASEATWEEAVHESRKALKKCRAVLRLARPSIGELYDRSNAALRDIGRSLSEVRDAAVMVETVEQLREASPGQATLDVVGPVRRILQERSDHAAEEAKEARLAERIAERIRSEASVIAGGPWEEEGWEFVEGGLRREYRRGRTAFADARRDPQGDVVHEWRKRVKDHWYHLRLLKGAWPPVLKRTAKVAHELSDLLGDEHDLQVLGEALRADSGAMWDPSRARSLIRLADRRRAGILAEAVPLGGLLFAEKPSRFTTRIHRYWAIASSKEEQPEVHDLPVAAGA